MHSNLHRFALLAGVAALLVAALLPGQKSTNASSNPPAFPQAKTSQPATQFTQGTIASIQANQIVINRTVRGKAGQMTFVLTSQTQRTGNLVVGARVSVQYREADKKNIAAAIRELQTNAPDKSGKTELKPKSKS